MSLRDLDAILGLQSHRLCESVWLEEMHVGPVLILSFRLASKDINCLVEACVLKFRELAQIKRSFTCCLLLGLGTP